MRRLTRTRFATTLGGLALLTLAAAFFGLITGPSDLAASDVFDALLGSEPAGAAGDIVLRIRLPRVMLALLVGASLATSGVVFQALLHNPLADPYVLGISGGAALAGIAIPDADDLGFGQEEEVALARPLPCPSLPSTKGEGIRRGQRAR